MRSILKSIVAAAAMLVVAPSFAVADDMGDGGNAQELLSRMSDLESQLRATNDALAAANARVDRLSRSGGQSDASLSALSKFLTDTEFSGSVAFSYFWNTNDPNNGNGPGANNGAVGGPPGPVMGIMPFHSNSNSFQVDQVWFSMTNEATPESRAGFQVEVLIGETADVLNGTGIATDQSGNFPHLYTANLSYLAPLSDAGLLFTAGRFESHIGVETADASENFNISRGLLYTFLPVSHTGIMASSSYESGLSWMLGVSNNSGFSGSLNNPAVAQNTDTDDQKALLWRVGYRASDALSARIGGIYGANCAVALSGCATIVGGTFDDEVGLLDIVVNWDPSDQLSTYLNYDYLWQDDEGAAGGTDPSAWALAGGGRFAITDATGFAVRGEFIRANQVLANTGTVPGANADEVDLWSITATLDHALTEHLTAKAELVYQEGSLDGVAGSSDNIFFFDDTPADLTDSQVVIGAQLIYAF